MWTELETVFQVEVLLCAYRQLFANKLTKSDNITVVFIAFSFPP